MADGAVTGHVIILNNSANPIPALFIEVILTIPMSPEALPDALDRYECRSCGYVYEPLKGDNTTQVAPNTAFTDIPEEWQCPVCKARKTQFSNIGPVGTPSGFKENLGYGIGVNTLTPGQKNLLIFGVLLLGFLFLISFYGIQ